MDIWIVFQAEFLITTPWQWIWINKINFDKISEMNLFIYLFMYCIIQAEKIIACLGHIPSQNFYIQPFYIKYYY